MSFVFFGVRDVLHPKFSNAVVTAGSHETSPNAFKREFQIILQSFEQQANAEITTQDAVDNGLDQRALSEIASQSALSEFLSHRNPPIEHARRRRDQHGAGVHQCARSV